MGPHAWNDIPFFTQTEKGKVSLDVFSYLFEEDIPHCLWGGAPRDIALKGTNAKPRDFDVVVDCSPEKFSEAMLRLRRMGSKTTKNALGGYHFSIEGVDFDVWRLSTTHRIDFIAGDRSPQFSDLLQVGNFNFEQCILRWNSSQFEGPATSDIRNGLIEMTSDDHPYPFVSLVRVMNAYWKFNQIQGYHVEVGPELESWLYRNFEYFSRETNPDYAKNTKAFNRLQQRYLGEEFFCMNDVESFALSGEIQRGSR